MAAQPRFLVDANVLMEAHRRYYRFGLCPGFWECIAWQHKQGTICSIDKVKAEIEAGKDKLSHWLKTECPKSFFCATTEPKVGTWYGEVMAWVQAQVRYTAAAKSKFAAVADGWLVAYAREHGFAVVTHEAPAPESRNEVKIPDACDAFGVEYMDTFDMLEKLKTKFTWKPTV